ncbi:MAG: HEAT repeat domain-containing protein [Methylacidiphilales bacterium]|nr:HEAT repeat domain-containing protein [Candidatus Methylacidiphilales bacterium]NJR18083.1 HEAT repeat domain-containing protein [Calothrix sp. CSU_2_0]
MQLTPEQEALNSTTTAERLCELAKSNKTIILQAIAVNPNTPPNILVKLFTQYPTQIFKNPALDLLILENPQFLDILYKQNKNIFHYQGLPLFFLKWAVQHENKDIRVNLAASSFTPVHILEILASDRNRDVRIKIVKNKSTPNQVLCNLISDRDEGVRLAVLNDIRIPLEYLIALSQNKEYIIRLSIAKNPRTPISVLQLLRKDSYESIRIAAQNNLDKSNIIVQNWQMRS